MSLTCRIEQQQDGAHASLAGEITEDSDFGPLLGLQTRRLVLDLESIRRINSCGVREWINFVTAVTKDGRTLVLERCSVPFVQQLNMINNFRGPAQITSVYAPYLCDSCSAEHLSLLDIATANPAALDPTMPCPNCGGTMEFDDLPDTYLGFVD